MFCNLQFPISLDSTADFFVFLVSRSLSDEINLEISSFWHLRFCLANSSWECLRLSERFILSSTSSIYHPQFSERSYAFFVVALAVSSRIKKLDYLMVQLCYFFFLLVCCFLQVEKSFLFLSISLELWREIWELEVQPFCSWTGLLWPWLTTASSLAKLLTAWSV